MAHCDGRHVVVATTVEVLERMIGVACDASLGERWRRLAAQLPADSERSETLLMCADELGASVGAGELGCCRGRALLQGDDKRA
jgi:hypothetical protein